MPLTPEQIKQKRKEEYEPFRRKLDGVETIIKADHTAWWFRTMLFLKRLERSIAKDPDQYPENIRAFYELIGPTILQHLATEVGSQNSTATSAHEVILRISEEIPRGLTLEHEAAEVVRYSLDDLVDSHSSLSFADWERHGRSGKALQITDSSGGEHLFPLPESEGIFHKGGFPRVLVKILAGAEQKLIDAELPPNDFDIIADSSIDTQMAEAEAAFLQVDADGIEYVTELDFSRLFLERDLNLNMAFVGKDALYYAPQAIESAQTGKIAVMSAHRGIYGTEFFVYDSEVLLKNRGLMRLFKTVVEGKATHFEFTLLNENISFGIYWLVLFRKFENKQDTAVYLDRLYELAQQTKQVPGEAANIVEVLDAVHVKYPFFDFDAGPLDDVGVARWLSKKLLRQIDAAYRHTNTIPNELVLERTEGDTLPYRVDLDEHDPDPTHIEWIENQIEPFLDRCRERTRAYHELIDAASSYDVDE